MGFKNYLWDEAWELNVSRGKVRGAFHIIKFGENLDIDSNMETIWDGGGLYTYLTSAGVLTVTSTDGDDAAAGTGARTVTVDGLDANYNQVSETLTVGGSAGSVEFFRVFRASVASSGSSGTNEGTISIASGATTLAQIIKVGTGQGTGLGQTLMSIYSIPAGYTGYVYQWDDAYFQNNSSSALFENSPFCADNLTPFNINTNNGNYNVIVIDERGCVASETIDIDTITNTFNSNTISVSVLDVTCFDGYNGSITISSITGGTSSYNFLWSGPPGFSQNIQNVSSLVAGSYAVIVTDSLGCQRTKNITVNEPDQLYYSIYNSIDETCTGDGSTVNSNGSCDGQIMVNVFGGTGNYYWDETESNVSPIPNSNQVQIINDTLIKDLCSGLHNIYVTDDNNCEGQVFPGGIGILTINTLVNVNVPGVNWTPTTCSYNTDGTAWMQSSPGADPLFDYSWETFPNNIYKNKYYYSLSLSISTYSFSHCYLSYMLFQSSAICNLSV